MSRSATPVSSAPTVAGRKRKDATLFVERKRPRSSEGPTKTPKPGKVAAQGPSKQDASQPEQEKPGPGFGTPQSEERPRKKPGLAARSSAPPVRPTSTSKPLVAPLRNVRLPSGAIMPWDVSSERLTAEMQAYTLEEIGRTLARQDEEAAAEASRLAALKAAKSASSPQKYSSKFKPKKPALRYAERHPGEKVVPEHEAMEVDEAHIGDEDDEDMGDGEYIIDTYVRIPADALQTDEQPKNFGLLVLDSQPDIDEFYQEEEDSEEEDDDEEEDENGISPSRFLFLHNPSPSAPSSSHTNMFPAENHYTADYPDEEVASDDEFDRNAYNYRTGNASDLEEYDEEFEDDVALSDDDGDATKYPWKAKPWMRGVEKSILDAEEEV
jgi:hypothetical protein